MYLIMAKKIFESPFHTNTLSKQARRSRFSAMREISVLSFSSSRMGMSGLTSRMRRLRSKGLISSMRIVRITMSNERLVRISIASSPKETLVIRGAVERLSW